MQNIDDVRINFDTGTLWILNIALAVVMFGVALGISVSDFKTLAQNPKAVLVGVLSQFVVLPFVTYLVVLALEPKPSIALGMFMVAACPGGNISNFMTHLAKGNAALSVCLTAISSVLALLMTPVNFQFYGAMYKPTANLLENIALQPTDVLEVVFLILGIPLVLGMLCRYYKPEMAIKLAKVLKPFSIIVFVAIVIIAFSNNLDIFNNYIVEVLYLGIGHNFIAFIIGFLVAKGFNLSFLNQKTITIETGIQNSGLGLLLIFTFFNGLGGMAIMAAFWGIWHIISGLCLALFWSKQRNVVHDIKTI